MRYLNLFNRLCGSKEELLFDIVGVDIRLRVSSHEQEGDGAQHLAGARPRILVETAQL